MRSLRKDRGFTRRDLLNCMCSQFASRVVTDRAFVSSVVSLRDELRRLELDLRISSILKNGGGQLIGEITGVLAGARSAAPGRISMAGVIREARTKKRGRGEAGDEAHQPKKRQKVF